MDTLLRIWRVLDRRQRRQLWLLQGLSVLMSFSTLLGIAAVMPFFAVLADPTIIHHHALLSSLYGWLGVADERRFLIILGGAFVALVVAGNVVSLVSGWIISRYAQSIGSQFGSALFEEYVRRPYGFHARADATILATKVLYEADRVAIGIVENGLLFAANLVGIAVIVTTIVIVNPVVALCTSVALGASYGAVYLRARRRLRLNGQLQSVCAAERGRVVHEAFGAIKEVITTQSREYFQARFARASDAMGRVQANTQVIAQSPKYVLECLTAAGLVFAALTLSARSGADVPWLAELSFFALAAYRLLPALQQVFHALVKIRAHSSALDLIADDLHAARQNAGAQPPVEAAWRRRPQRAIELRSVSFRYSPELPDVLDGVNLRIPAGSIVALVGRNGAGKTALADLVLGLLEPQAGHIEIDGVRIDAANRYAWQSSVAYVPQQIFLREASLAENIAFGFSGRDIEPARLREAARLAQLQEFVASTPAGFDTLIGERGIRLSGGMRQRLGLARALYREAALLVLDEATNALDTAAEHEVIETVRALRGHKTIVVIAHGSRLTRIADEVFEVGNGTVRVRSTPLEAVV